MSSHDIQDDVERVLGAKINTTTPDDDVILVGSDYLTYSEVEQLCADFGKFYAERDAATGLRLAGIEFSYTPEEELDNSCAPELRLASSIAEVITYAEAELIPLIGLDRPFHKGNGVMFNSVEQGRMLLAAGKSSYLTAYLRLVCRFAPDRVPR